MKTRLDGDYITRSQNFGRAAALMLAQLHDPQSTAIEQVVAKSWLVSNGLLSELVHAPMPRLGGLFDGDRYRALPLLPLFERKGGEA